jgi:hypothetical protein
MACPVQATPDSKHHQESTQVQLICGLLSVTVEIVK